MNQVAELRRVLAEEMHRLQAQPGLERRVIDLALPRAPRVDRNGRRASAVPAVLRSPRARALVAVLLSITVVATLVLTANALRTMRSVPANSPQRPYTIPSPPRATGSCSAGPRQWAASPPNPARMTTTVGWAYGPMRTTDGGLHWANVSPPSISGRTPKNDEFFLDNTHAWVIETSSSSAACVDHVVVFRTGDGGSTWQQSAPIPVRISGAADVLWTGSNNHSALLDFIDAQHGWLLLGSGPLPTSPNGADSAWIGAAWRLGDLYRTTDGGFHWTLEATNPGFGVGCVPSAGLAGLVRAAITFSSLTTGWMPSSCGLLVTRDAGKTWTKASLPRQSSESPIFFDATHGAVLGDGSLMATSDGGITWALLPNVPPAPTTFYGVDFIDRNDAWAVGEGGNSTWQCDWTDLSPCNGNFRLYRTSDGGQTWIPGPMTSLMMPAPKWWPPAYLHFCDGRNGFLSVGESPNESGLFRTTDGGLTWARVNATIQGS